MVRSALEGTLRVSMHAAPRTAPSYLLVGRDGAARPEPRHAAWLYAQMVRWRQATLSDEVLAAAVGCFRPDLFDSAIGEHRGEAAGPPPDGIGAFAGPAFNPDDISGYLKACAPIK
jgi:NitT/TauT family transport system ATP-binding protein